MSLIEAIERCPEEELENIWATDLGDRYWAWVRYSERGDDAYRRTEKA